MSNQIGSLGNRDVGQHRAPAPGHGGGQARVGGTMEDIRRAAAGAAAALGAIGVGLSVGALAGWVKASIDAADALDEWPGALASQPKS